MNTNLKHENSSSSENKLYEQYARYSYERKRNRICTLMSLDSTLKMRGNFFPSLKIAQVASCYF